MTVLLLLEIEFIARLLLEQIEHSLKHIVVIHANIGHLILIGGILILDDLEDDHFTIVILGRQQHNVLVALVFHGRAELKLHVHAILVGQDDDVIVFHILHIIHG